MLGIELSPELIALILVGGMVTFWVAKKIIKLVLSLAIVAAAIYFLAPYAGLLL